MLLVSTDLDTVKKLRNPVERGGIAKRLNKIPILRGVQQKITLDYKGEGEIQAASTLA